MHTPGVLTVADTAYAIAAVRAQEAELPPAQRLFDDRYAAIFAAAGEHAAEGTARYLSLPFFRDGIRLRTRFIDDVVRDGVAAGLGQVVLLGAGFDARGLRLPELAGRAVFEVDFPGQLRRKRDLLRAAGVELPSSIRYVGCDFADPDFESALTTSIEAAGFRVGAGAMFVWEGVIGYIDAAMIDRSLAWMSRVGGPGSRVVFTFGQPNLDPDTAAERAAGAGFRACEELGTDELWRRYFGGEPHPAATFSRMGVAFV